MRPRVIPVLFLFVASIILLAHTIVPHHHHDDQACFVSKHCLDDKTGNNESENHSHDTDNESCCVLKQVVVTPPQNSRIATGQQLKIKNSENYPAVHYADVLRNDYDPLPDFNIRHLNFYDCISPYTLILHNSRGSRAPPIS